MILWIAALLFLYRMGIIESHQPFAAFSMQRERIIKSMRLLWRGQRLRKNELDPMIALGVNSGREAVRLRTAVETRIVHPHTTTCMSEDLRSLPPQRRGAPPSAWMPKALGVVVEFRRAGHDEPTLLAAMDVPAAPCGFMCLMLLRRTEINVGDLANEIDLLLPALDTLQVLRRITDRLDVFAAKCLDDRRFAGQNDHGCKGDARFAALVHSGAGKLRFVLDESYAIRERGNASGTATSIGGDHGERIDGSRRRLGGDENPTGAPAA